MDAFTMRLILTLFAAQAVFGCVAPPGPMARVRESAQELNVDLQFGRNELAMARVAPSAREDFVARHRGWGSSVRIADLDLQGMKPSGEHDIDVFVRIAWYRLDQQDLLTTIVKQTWREDGLTTGWQLVSEQRIDGALGLLAEPVVFQSPTEPRPPARFPTIRIGESLERSTDVSSEGTP
jgi:hypothetical protein